MKFALTALLLIALILGCANSTTSEDNDGASPETETKSPGCWEKRMDENGNYYGVYVCGVGDELFALRENLMAGQD